MNVDEEAQGGVSEDAQRSAAAEAAAERLGEALLRTAARVQSKKDEQSETESEKTVVLRKGKLVQRTRGTRSFSEWVWDDLPSQYEDTAPWHEYPAAGASTQTDEVQEEEQEAQGADTQAAATQTGRNPRPRAPGTKRRGAPRYRDPPAVRVARRYEEEQRVIEEQRRRLEEVQRDVEEARRARGSFPTSSKGSKGEGKEAGSKVGKGGSSYICPSSASSSWQP